MNPRSFSLSPALNDWSKLAINLPAAVFGNSTGGELGKTWLTANVIPQTMTSEERAYRRISLRNVAGKQFCLRQEPNFVRRGHGKLQTRSSVCSRATSVYIRNIAV